MANLESPVPNPPSAIGLLWLRLFSYYLLATAIIYVFAVVVDRAPSPNPLASLLSLFGTTYMAASVRNYRRRILQGEPYPGSLKVFRAFYWAGVVVIVLVSLAAGHGSSGGGPRSLLTWLVVGAIIDIVWIVILSSLYCPVDIIWRLRAKREPSSP